MKKLKQLDKLNKSLLNHKILQQKNHHNKNTKIRNQIQYNSLKKQII